MLGYFYLGVEEEGDGGQDPNLRGYKYQRSEESTVRHQSGRIERAEKTHFYSNEFLPIWGRYSSLIISLVNDQIESTAMINVLFIILSQKYKALSRYIARSSFTGNS